MLAGTPDPATAQWSVSAFLGNAWNASGALDVTAPPGTALTLDGIRYDDKSFKSPVYYGVRVAHFFRQPSWLAVEGEFIHLKAIPNPAQAVSASGRFDGRLVSRTTELGEFLPHFELSHGLNFLLANVAARVPVMRNGAGAKSPRVSLTVRGGMGPTLPHVEGEFQGQVENSYQFSRLGWQAAAGVQTRVVGHLVVLSEIKWTSTHQRVDIGEATVDGPFRARQFVVGLGWETDRRVP
jgi:hypothetical protein